MSVYTRFIRARRGMSTIFASLFFIILVLMSFNLLVWNLAQYDNYKSTVISMNQRDQQAASEKLAATAPGATGFVGNTFNIIVNNTGRVTVTVARIYILNVSPIGSGQCSGSAVCIIDPGSPVNCAGNGKCVLANASVESGESDHNIVVTGLRINDGSGYRVTLSSSRGRQFSFYYPWPVNAFGPFGSSNSNATNTDHGPLDIQSAPNSLNFTQGTWTTSQPAWNFPYNVNIVFWVKVINNGAYPITLSKYSDLYLICEPPGRDCEDVQDFFVSDNRTTNPTNIVAYDEVNRPIVLPAAGPNGPNGSTIVKFGSFTPAGNTAEAVTQATPYLIFMIFFFQVSGQTVGQALTFFAARACVTYPSCP